MSLPSGPYSRYLRSFKIERAPEHLTDALGALLLDFVSCTGESLGRWTVAGEGKEPGESVALKILAGPDMLQPKEIESRINSHVCSCGRVLCQVGICHS